MGGEETAKLTASRGVLSDERRSGRRNPPSPKEAPWLVFPYQVKGNKENQAFYNICQPNDRTYRKFIPELSGKSFYQKNSHQGWLIVICDDENYNYGPNWDFGDCFLWNPALLETIQLPSVLTWYYEPYELVDCVLSSSPGTGGANDEPMVLMLFKLQGRDVGDHNMLLVFCHVEDEQWRTKWILPEDATTDQYSGICYLCCFKDNLYFMSWRYSDPHLEIGKEQLWDEDNDTVTVSEFETSNKTGYPWRDGQDHLAIICHYVESSDELFYVLILYNGMQDIKVFNSVVVLRLDLSSMEWKLVTCLGDHVLFISPNTGFCCSASKLGLSTGCLCYTFQEDQGLYKFDVQSSRNSVILPCLKLPTPWFSSDWIMILDERQEKDEKDCTQTSAVVSNEMNENKDEEFEQTSSWDILDADSKELVASYLHPLDYVHFRSVCKTMRGMMPVSKSTFATSSITKTTYLFPWLVFCRNKNDTVYNFIIPVRIKENYLIKFSESLLGATIRFQKDGWLLMSRDEILFFYNPFTREAINLPHLPEHNFHNGFMVLPKHYFPYVICFCSLPTSADCIVFAIDQSRPSNPRTITFYSITKGNQVWDIFSFDNAMEYMPLWNPPIFHQGAFYCLDYNGLIGTFNLEDNSWKVHGTPLIGSYEDTYPYPSFLVKSGEDLILVKLGCQENLVRIYKLNFPVMNWVEVESLGKRMLFISRTSCVSAVAPNSEMENKIYFPRLCLNGDGILFYSLETGRYDSFGGQHSSKNLYETEGWRENCTWIEPSWTKFTPQELNWFEPPL